MKALFRGVLAGSVFSALALVVPASAAEIIVLDSSAASIKAGSVIQSDAVVNIPAGRKITIMETDGSVRAISGPFDGAVSKSAKAGGESHLISGLAKLVTERSERKAVLGAVRAVDKNGDEAGLYAVDVTKSEIFCLPAGKNPVLWRPDRLNLDAQFAIRNWHNQDDVRVAMWRRGDSTLAWPPNLQIGGGADYVLRMDVALQDTQLRVHRIPQDLNTTADRVVWMAQTGCERQARLLLDDMIDKAN